MKTWLASHKTVLPKTTGTPRETTVFWGAAMCKPSQPWRITVATCGRLLVQLMDYAFLVLGIAGSATGFVLVALGVQDRYSTGVFFIGTVFLLGFLVMIFAWSFSHRLTVLTKIQRQTNEFLEELLRRTER